MRAAPAILLLLCLSGCITRGKVPLEAASLEAAKKQCHAHDAFFLGRDSVGFPGLYDAREGQKDYSRQMDCLSGKLQGESGEIVFLSV